MRDLEIASYLPSWALRTSIYMIRKKNTSGWGSQLDSFGVPDLYCVGLWRGQKQPVIAVSALAY